MGISTEFPSGTFSDKNYKNLDHQAFFDFLLSGGEAWVILCVTMDVGIGADELFSAGRVLTWDKCFPIQDAS